MTHGVTEEPESVDLPATTSSLAPPDSARMLPLARYVCLPLAAVASLLIIVGPALRYRAAVRRRENPEESATLSTLFDVNTEANVPTWFSTSLWVAAALAALTIAGLLVSRTAARAWWVLAGFLLLFSLDEAAVLHERLLGEVGESALGDERTGLLHFAWVLPGAAVALAVATICGRLVWSLPRHQRFMVVAAGAVFVAGALGAESLSGAALRAYGDARMYVAMTSLEEASEMAAVILLLAALLSLIRVRRDGSGLRLDVDAHLLRPRAERRAPVSMLRDRRPGPRTTPTSYESSRFTSTT